MRDLTMHRSMAPRTERLQCILLTLRALSFPLISPFLCVCRDDDDAHYDDFANQLREELKKGAAPAAQKAGGK